MYPMVAAAESPRFHVLDTVEIDDLVGGLSSLGGGVHLGDRGEEHGPEAVLLEVHLKLYFCDFGGGLFELGRGVAAGEVVEVDSRWLGRSEGLGRER